jgi:hypothetical protein
MQLGEWGAAERAEGEEREMNPLNWKRQHQVAGIAFCVLGAITPAFSSLGWTRRSDSCLRTLFPASGPT